MQSASMEEIEIVSKQQEIGARLKEARKNAGLSLRQAGDLMGAFHSTICSIESAERGLSAMELYQLCNIYDVAPDWVMGTQTEADLDPALVAQCEKLLPNDKRKLLRLLSSIPR